MSSNYARELTYELRHRGLSDAEISDVLRELPPLTPEELRTEFGTPSAYAESFPKGKRQTAGAIIISVAVVIAALAVLWRVVSVFFLGVSHDLLISLAFLGGGLLLVAVAAIIAAQVDRRPIRSAE